MDGAVRARAPRDPAFESYARLAQGLIADVEASCLFDGERRALGFDEGFLLAPVRAWIDELGWNGTQARQPAARAFGTGQWVTALPLERTDTTLIGIFCVQQALRGAPGNAMRHAADIGRRLKPLLDCVFRELEARVPVRERVQEMAERTAELEWLFRIVSHTRSGTDDRHAIREMLAAATERLDSAMGICAIPDKRICVEYMPEAIANSTEAGWRGPKALRGVWTQTRQHLLNWAQRRNAPLVINSAGRESVAIPRCKIMSVPVTRDTGKVIGVLAFVNPPFAEDYASRHVFLARHLGLQAASVVDMQFDLMTGLYTQSGLDQVVTGQLQASAGEPCSLVYVDVDHMHIVNQGHGFEIGNELIVRIADLMAPPLLPGGALAARLSGDRFGIVLPGCDTRAAERLAGELQRSIAALKVGPTENPVEASVSCGIADLVAMPQGLERSIGVAEIACKTAKSRGGNRIELFTSDDRSMMRRQDDAIAVARLRAALKGDRLVLHAQRVRPVRDPALPGSYEVLVRLRDDGDEAVPLGRMLRAAERYNLMPSIDRWVTAQLVATLSAYGGLLRSSGIDFLVPLAGCSFADAAFVARFAEQLRAAGLPQGSISIQFTEQAATLGLAHAKAMTRVLKKHGCRFALDDFAMGKDALTQIRSLEISRVRFAAALPPPAVRSIVEFARVVSVATVACAVDTEDRTKSLQALGVDYLQGEAIAAEQPLAQLLQELGSEESRRQQRLRLELG